jgi:lipopolysaccharide biosynthesis regulator YciM
MKNSKDILLLLEGIDSIINGNIKNAISTFKKSILEGNQNPAYYIILGKLYRQQKDYLRAIKIHESTNSIENLDKNIKEYNMLELIHSYYEYGDYEKSLYYANNIKVKNLNVYKIMADSFLQLKKYEDAIKIYKKLEKQKRGTFLRNIAYSYFLEAEENMSIISSKNLSTIKKGLKYYDRSRKGYMLLIEYYYNKKETHSCINAIEHFIVEKLAKSESDLNILEKIYFDIDEIENFASKILLLFSQDEQNIFFALYLVDYYLRLNKIDKALEILKKNIEKNGIKNLIVRKYLSLKNDTLLSNLVSEYNYKCLKCDCLYTAYTDICNKCKSIESLKPF